MPKEFNKKRDASRPTKSTYRGNDKGSGSERSGENSYSKSNDFNAKPSGDRPFRKSYAENVDKPRESKEGGERKPWSSDRPKKSYTSDFKPRETKEGTERKPWSSDRPKKTFSSDFKSKETRSNSEEKSWSSDRPKKPYTSDFKSKENKDSGERKPWSSDRPKKPYSSDFKPRENKDGEERKSWNSERPKKSFSSDFKPRERSEGGERKSYNSNRPIKKFDNKGSKYSPENFGVTGENSESAKPRRARVSPVKKKTELDENDVQYGSVRLNKYIANAGICSRREADVLIETGAITVNGKIVSELGYKVSATDIVAYGGQGIRREKSVYILLNKPKDYITTADDPLERKTVMHLIKGACKERVYPVGRLDRNSTGLLIMTNDGELTKKLTHPRYEKKKIYHIELDRPLTKDDMQKILEGVELEDGMVHVDEISYVTGAASKKEVGIELHSGKNRVIRRIFEHLSYDVKKLDRVYFAGLSKKDLPRGRWRFLTDREVAMLNSK